MNGTASGKRDTARRLIPFAVATLGFVAMAALYAAGARPLYDHILQAWGIDPFAFPFLDTDTVLSAVRCLRAGIDVFVVNPCDVIGRVYDYSPLWLVLAKLPVTASWVVPAGLVVDLAFLASLVLLPPGRSAVETLGILLGTVSTAVVFAVERGNNDLVLFVLASIAATLARRSPALRMLGYGVALLAGLLKYYPMALMAMAVRERPARFLWVAAGSVLIVLLFVATMGHDLVRALRLIPVGSWFGDMFGSSTLPGGLSATLGWPPATATSLRLILVLGALGMGIAIGRRMRTRAALDRLTEEERMSLFAGTLLILGCFFTAQNIGYRAVHLLFVIPALTALRRTDGAPRWTATLYAALALLWSECWRRGLSGEPVLFAIGWLLREALWWWTVTMLIALVTGLVLRSTLVGILAHRDRPAVR
jgi:hypothetical protein